MRSIQSLIVTMICTILLSGTVVASTEHLDQIEAIVNQEVILSSDVKRMEKDIRARYLKMQQALPSKQKLRQQILDKLINDSLQLQVAERMGLRLDNAQVDQTIQQILKKEGKNIAQYQQELSRKGQSYQAFSDSVRNELTINEIRQMQVRQRLNISEQEINLMVQRLNKDGKKNTQFHFIHILLKTDPNAPLHAQQQAKKIMQRLAQGESASSLARQYSQGPKALDGGDWGWRTVDEIPSLFADKFDELKTKKGDILGPFKTRLGLSIIQVSDKKGIKNTTTLEVNARHILIKSNIILSDKKAKLLLNTYRQEILEGKANFAELARAHSQDPGSAVKGGNLGWADPNMYVPEFRDRAQSLRIGEISKPFHTMHGWHILEVLEKRQADTTEKASKQKAYSILYKQRFPAEVYAWMNEIRQEAYIKIVNDKPNAAQKK
ncbi:peptidylprolyl isomerase [Psychromonas sp. CNPT3]|uniref:peptidylprolyl isomerase n=1 Tax=Psychromonas sp. CNPT3 TaxID=314282 RepID=UPI00059FF74A|nr:peptidylprolyl isomerase [Psychromonas sp. CNPT3]